jgi:hypothetical protein
VVALDVLADEFSDVSAENRAVAADPRVVGSDELRVVISVASADFPVSIVVGNVLVSWVILLPLRLTSLEVAVAADAPSVNLVVPLLVASML